MQVASCSSMKTFIPFVTGALIASASLPAFAGYPMAMHPEESIPDSLPRLTSPGPYDSFIKEVQQKLHELRFDAGPVNGEFGEKTQAALAQFQLANLLPASGMLDDQTLNALGVERPQDAAGVEVSAR